MAENFKLKPPGSGLVTTQLAAELLTTAAGKKRAEGAHKADPGVVGYANAHRLPPAASAGCRQAQHQPDGLVVAALRRTLPALLVRG